MERAPSLVSRTLTDASLAVTEIRGNPEKPFKSAPIPPEHAWLIAVQLHDFPDRHYWEDGRQARVRHLRAGDVVLYDVRRDPVALLDGPFHSIHFYLPRSALDRVADEAGAPDIETLDYEPGIGIDDPVIRHFGLAMRGILGRGDRPARLVADQSRGHSRPMSRRVMPARAPSRHRPGAASRRGSCAARPSFSRRRSTAPCRSQRSPGDAGCRPGTSRAHSASRRGSRRIAG